MTNGVRIQDLTTKDFFCFLFFSMIGLGFFFFFSFFSTRGLASCTGSNLDQLVYA
jgi:hypothetical protein